MPRRKKIDPAITWMKKLQDLMLTVPEDRQMVVIVEHEDGMIGANATCCPVCALRMVEFAGNALARELSDDECMHQSSVH